MAKQTIQQKLKALQKDWKNTEARQGYEDLPGGDYEGVIKNAVLGLTKDEKNPKLMATYTLEVTEGDFKGRTQYKRQMAETADNIAYAKGDLDAIGVDAPDDIADLGDTFEQEVVGLPILFSVVHNKEFVNVYFRERLEGAEKVESGDDSNGDDDALTADDVRSYLDEDDEGESMFKEIIKDNELGIDPDEYATWSEVADLIIDQLELE